MIYETVYVCVCVLVYAVKLIALIVFNTKRVFTST